MERARQRGGGAARTEPAEAGGGRGEHEVVVREPLPLARFMMELDEQWPILRFMSWGFYYAWIWLSYNSSMLVGEAPAGSAGTGTVFSMYLASTMALAAVLILAAAFPRISARIVERRGAGFVLSLVVCASTLGVAAFSPRGAADPLFLLSSVLTGVGTAWVALRAGAVYAAVSARQATMYATASIAFAALMYFLAVGVPHDAGVCIMACLPVLAAVCTMTTSEEPVVQVEQPQRAQALPRWFFFRFVLAIAVFSVVVGVTRGYSTLTQAVGTLDEQGSVIVLGAALVCLAMYVLVSFLGGDFDISRLYYPVIILAVAGISIMPLLGNPVFEGHFINIAYVCFVTMVWCLCAHVSNRSGLAPVRVFGLGRGASALGTTVGWLLGSQLIARQAENPTLIVAVSVAMILALLVVSMLVFNDRMIGAVLRASDNASNAGPGAVGNGLDACGEESMSDGEMCDPAEGDSAAEEGGLDGGRPRRTGLFTKRCLYVAETYKLSQRERDVLFLLAKGRTISYISEDLSVSFNTAKSHVRHVYAKMGVHDRQEFLDLIEGIEMEG